MTNYYDDANPVIENGKLILVSNGGSKQYIGIRAARKQLADLEGKTNLSESSIARRDVLRKAVALWDAWSSH